MKRRLKFQFKLLTDKKKIALQVLHKASQFHSKTLIAVPFKCQQQSTVFKGKKNVLLSLKFAVDYRRRQSQENRLPAVGTDTKGEKIKNK